MLGPGKYDDILTEVRELVGVGDEAGGAVILIVIGGKRGNGFCVQADLEHTLMLPDMLEHVAREMRGDIDRGPFPKGGRS